MTETVDGLFLSALERYPDRTFSHHLTPRTDERITYAEAAQRIATIVECLGEVGLRSGDRIVCHLEDTRPSLYFVLACAHAGVVMVPISPAFSDEAVARLNVGMVFTSSEHGRRLLEGGFTPIGFDDGFLPEGMRALRSAPKSSFPEALTVLRRASSGHGGDATYFHLPTSGTTGEPKLPIRTHRAAAQRANLIAAHMGVTSEEENRFLLIAALTHSAAHSILATGLSVAAEFCIPAEVDTNASLDEVRALDPTHLTCAPRALGALYRQFEARGRRPGQRLFGPSMKVVRTTAAPSDESMMRDLATQGVDVGEIFGATEFGTIAATPLQGWRPGHVGTLLPGVTVKIAADGEILIRCEGERVEYFGDPELSRAAMTEDGFYRSMDCGELTADGYLRIHGRKRDVFNTFEGSNVYPQRIETFIENLPAVDQAVLVGDQRPYFGALIVVGKDLLPAQAPDTSDGYLDEHRFSDLYERLRSELIEVNRNLEAVERVKRFALFDRPMASELYSPAQAGKVRRMRKQIDAAYAERIEALYSPPSSTVSVIPE